MARSIGNQKAFVNRVWFSEGKSHLIKLVFTKQPTSDTSCPSPYKLLAYFCQTRRMCVYVCRHVFFSNY